MPNRILKQTICTSPNLNTLSVGAENFFYRLIVQCDDYGRYHADPSILRAYCYPLRIDDITNQQIIGWMTELAGASLLFVYSSGRYLQMFSWSKHQSQPRSASKFPDPLADEINCAQLQADACKCKQMSPYSYSLTYSQSLTTCGENEKQAANAAHTPKTPDKKQPSKTGKAKGETSKQEKRKAWVKSFREAPHQVRAFVAVRGRYPPKEVWHDITSAVPDETKSLRLWCYALKAYSKAGYNRQAVDGPLGWFKHGVPQKFQVDTGAQNAARQQSIANPSGNPNAGRYKHAPFDPTRDRVKPI